MWSRGKGIWGWVVPSNETLYNHLLCVFKSNIFNMEHCSDMWAECVAHGLFDATSQAETGFHTFLYGGDKTGRVCVCVCVSSIVKNRQAWDVGLTSNGILLFWPVSLKAWARRKTSSTPTPRAKKGSTCSTQTDSVNLGQGKCFSGV